MPACRPCHAVRALPLGGVVAATGLAVALGAPAAQAATVGVRCADSAALVSAINTANAAATATTISIQPGSGSCRFLLTAAAAPGGPDAGADNGLPIITADVTISSGRSPQPVIQRDAAAANFRIFEVAGSGRLTLKGVTVSGGQVNANGGAFFVNDGGQLTLDGSTVTKNTAIDNPVLSFGELVTEGGAIANNGGLTTILRSTVSANRAIATIGQTVGGGIVNAHGTLIMRRSRLVDNHAISADFPGSFGGGLTSNDGVSPVTIEDSVISANSAEGRTAVGGALSLDRRSTIVRTQITGNRTIARSNGPVPCPLEGGFIVTECNTGSAFAGAAVWNQGKLTLADSSITANTSTAIGSPHPVVEGAGLTNTGSYNPRPPGNPVPGQAELTRTTIVGNVARAVGPGSEVRGAGIANQDGIVENQRGPANPPGSSFLKLHSSLVIGNIALASITHGGGLYNYVNALTEHALPEPGGGRSQQTVTLDGGTRIRNNVSNNCEQQTGTIAGCTG